jgi:hypothetical protein
VAGVVFPRRRGYKGMGWMSSLIFRKAVDKWFEFYGVGGAHTHKHDLIERYARLWCAI